MTALLVQVVISRVKKGPARQEAEELRGGQAALSLELENQAQGQEGGRMSAVTALWHCLSDHIEAEIVTSPSLFPIISPREMPINPWRITKILKWVLGTKVWLSGLGWVLFLSGDVLPGAALLSRLRRPSSGKVRVQTTPSLCKPKNNSTYLLLSVLPEAKITGIRRSIQVISNR